MLNASVLKFHIQIPHIKLVDPYFSCPDSVPFQSCVPSKTKIENFVCKIFQKAFEPEPIYWYSDGTEK